ncbi:WD40 repeat-like protein [Athelia psychrophila]|uniref:WD40 repeat-like protein n=1 Tax=Athelia psychrophila TaxID=1759441 RepID=A0A166NB93_9AGAM|nr:WD40 repeat-like protein [Fibularhizoctonia sp. CBS 109695]
MLPPTTSSYVCDTLPAPRLASVVSRSELQPERSPSPPSSFVQVSDDMIVINRADGEQSTANEGQIDLRSPSPPPARKLCVRHQRMADEGTNLKLQQCLDALPVQERESVNAIWSNFSSSSHPRRALILQGLLTMCCFSQLSLLTEQLAQLIRIDCFSVFPREVSLKVLGYLDATSLCRAAQVSKPWRRLADDDILWRGICEQHIGQKCLKCGWGLPILERRRTKRSSPGPSPPLPKRALEPASEDVERPLKRQRSEVSEMMSHHHHSHPKTSTPAPEPHDPNSLLLPTCPSSSIDMATRPWKDVYSERLTVERNWRRGRCTVRTLKGHTDGVMCLQFSETLSHPSFPILITGSYDRTARVWNLETGAEVACLKGHTRAIRALQFDEAKLITGSMDCTIRVWDWRRGKCIRTLEGHTEGVVCLNYDSNVLASGSVDATIKVWNFRTGAAFTLRGHSDWVNSVQLWDSDMSIVPHAPVDGGGLDTHPPGPQIDPGKMLFSASDDGSIRLWDLTLRACVRQFTGHIGQVQSMRLLLVDEGCDDEAKKGESASGSSTPPDLAAWDGYPGGAEMSEGASSTKRRTPVLISGSLDNTIKIWDIRSGKATKTLFGHIEGVWAVASDKLRLVSGSHDRTIKVWAREDGRCTATLVGHRGAVTCLALGEDKIISGSDDGDVRLWSFSG